MEQFGCEGPSFLRNLSFKESDWNCTPKFLISVPVRSCDTPIGQPAGGFGLRHLSSLPAGWHLLEWVDGPRDSQMMGSLGCVRQPGGSVPSFDLLLEVSVCLSG